MKKIVLKFGILVATLCVTSCNILDVPSTDVILIEDFYKTKQDLEGALRGVYTTLASTKLYGGDMLARMGLSADIGYEVYSTDEGTVGYYDVTTTDTKVLGYWRELYAGINRANLLLEHIDDVEMSEEDEALRERWRAEATFLRAYFHFMLTTRFGDIPLMLKSVESCKMEDLQVAQSSQREVYLNIIDEMSSCVGNLPTVNEVESAGRISQTAAYGIMTRVCLYMAGRPLEEQGMYARAKSYAKKVIDSGLHALNPSYEQVFINLIQDRYDLKESMFEVEFWGNNETSYSSVAGRVGRDNGIQVSSSNAKHQELGISIGALRATPYFLEHFADGDLRKDWTISPYSYNSDGTTSDQTANFWIRYCGKFRRSYEIGTKGVNYTPINFPIIRYADVLLMYAECVAADDNSSASEVATAWEYLNQVRRRGYGVDIYTANESVDFLVSDRNELLDVVREERARELGFELLRKDDLIRWGVFYNNMRDIAPTIPAGFTSSYYVAARQYFGNVSARDVLWPIPYYEISVNGKLSQNNGW